jgi:RimJ/RimL family protein N-acetyltransferase
VTKRGESDGIYLETERLVLRRLTDDDIDPLFDLDSDPDVMRYLTGGVPHTREFIVRKALPHYLSFYERYTDFGFWAAVERSSGAFIGWFHFRPFKENPEEIELGYRLKKAHWGRGLATEGSRALIEKGFLELGVQTVVATTMAVNHRSRHVMEKLGMRLECEFDFPGEPFPGWTKRDCREVKYRLTREEVGGVPGGLRGAKCDRGPQSTHDAG